MNHLKLTNDKLDLTTISDLVVDESCGAISFFVGTTRDNFEDKKVLKLEYEAYDAMALKALTKICETIRTKWTATKHIAIYHRLGVVPVKEASIIIAISSPHRQDSLEAVQFAIDEVKRSVPIWKKEIYGGINEVSDSNLPRKRIKRTRNGMNLALCCPIKNDIVVPKELLQIRADESEMKRRINCFIERKREEIDLNNIQEFIERKPTKIERLTEAKEDKTDENMVDEESSTCARVCSTVYRIKGSSTHLQIDRVKNEIGPQTTTNSLNALNKLMESQTPEKHKSTVTNTSTTRCPDGVEERLTNAEHFLNLPKATNKSVFERLKSIENRILFLESISPEYNRFSTRPIKVEDNLSSSTDCSPFENVVKNKKKIFTVEDLDSMIAKLEKTDECN